MNLSEISRLSEDQAREYFEQIRWPNGPVCPHCGSVESKKLQGKVHRDGLYKCSWLRRPIHRDHRHDPRG